MTRVVLSLGANMGDRAATLRTALAALAALLEPRGMKVLVEADIKK